MMQAEAIQAGTDIPELESLVWIPALVERIADFLPPNEVACTLRLVNKATAVLFCRKTRVQLSQPSPEHAFQYQWRRPGALRQYTALQQRDFTLQTIATGSVDNLKTALEVTAEAITGEPFSIDEVLPEQLYSQLEGISGYYWHVWLLERAASAKKQDAFWWLIARGFPVTADAVTAAVEGNNLDLMDWMLQQHPQVRAKVKPGELLQAAAKHCSLAELQRLYTEWAGAGADAGAEPGGDQDQQQQLGEGEGEQQGQGQAAPQDAQQHEEEEEGQQPGEHPQQQQQQQQQHGGQDEAGQAEEQPGENHEQQAEQPGENLPEQQAGQGAELQQYRTQFMAHVNQLLTELAQDQAGAQQYLQQLVALIRLQQQQQQAEQEEEEEDAPQQVEQQQHQPQGAEDGQQQPEGEEEEDEAGEEQEEEQQEEEVVPDTGDPHNPHWSRLILRAAIGSPTPDWQDKVVWLEGQGHPRDGFNPGINLIDVCGGACWRPDAPERLAWLQGRGYTLGVDTLVAACHDSNLAAVEYLLDPTGGGVVPGPDFGSNGSLWTSRHHESGLRVAQALHARGFTVPSLGVVLDAASSSGYRKEVVVWLAETFGLRQEDLEGRIMQGAVEAGHLDLVRWLVEDKGCRLTGRCIQWAAHGGCEAMLEWLVEHGCPLEDMGRPYETAAHENHTAIMREMARLGVPFTEADRPHRRAAQWGNMRMLRLLTQIGYPFRPTARTLNVWARSTNEVEPLQWLVEEAGCPADWLAAARSVEGEEARTNPAGIEWLRGQLEHWRLGRQGKRRRAKRRYQVEAEQAKVQVEERKGE